MHVYAYARIYVCMHACMPVLNSHSKM
jgi:hypothetical protein